jgi:hypothetical protein
MTPIDFFAGKELEVKAVAGRRWDGKRWHYFDESDPFPLDELEMLYTIEVKNDAKRNK